MAGDSNPSPHLAWAHLRFSIVGPLLSAPPAHGELTTAIEALAQKAWRHPITGEPVRFSVKTIERWYYKARGARRDPVGALRKAELDAKGTREFIKVLRLLENASIRELADAIRQTLTLGVIGYEAVRVTLQARREKPIGLFSLDGRPHLKRVCVQPPDLGAYRALMTGGTA